MFNKIVDIMPLNALMQRQVGGQGKSKLLPL